MRDCVRWKKMFETRNIWDEMKMVQQRMDSLFDDFFSNELLTSGGTNLLEGHDDSEKIFLRPLTDSYETDKHFVTQIDLPGVAKGDIHVNVTENGVEVKVERKHEIKQEDKEKGMYRMERAYAGFYRLIPLPRHVDLSRAESSYKDGVLEIKVPKISGAKASMRRLPVK
jgi:HSP20 family molecular chaperone IbpA